MEASAPAAVPPRLKERYEAEIRPKLQKRFGYASVMEVPRIEKITLNMGVGEAKQDSNMLDAAREQLATIAGQQPSIRPRPQVDRRLQAARGHAGRRQRHAAARAHVRVPRPADVGRDPAHPRLPRPQRALLRRARQLLDGRARADHLPGDRLRRDRSGARTGRDDHHVGQDRRGGLCSVARAWECRSRRRELPATTRRLPRTSRRSVARRRRASAPRPSRRRSRSSRRRTRRRTRLRRRKG